MFRLFVLRLVQIATPISFALADNAKSSRVISYTRKDEKRAAKVDLYDQTLERIKTEQRTMRAARVESRQNLGILHLRSPTPKDPMMEILREILT